MRIGQVAQIVGVSARSIRHYHRLGVVAEPARTAGGYREYNVTDLARIARIAFLSDSGVSLKEIAALLEPEAGDPATDLAAIRDGIDERIAALTRQRDRLDAIAQRAAAGLPPGPAARTRRPRPRPVSSRGERRSGPHGPRGARTRHARPRSTSRRASRRTRRPALALRVHRTLMVLGEI
ncbi:MerR family transcriptional regulator [Dietzia cinnamea P4]|nr:MerR family transcriptional regulator [Dietzia cinnamea P4]